MSRNYSLKEYKKLVEKELVRFFDWEIKRYEAKKTTIPYFFKYLKEYSGRKGKRLRPLLAIAAYNSFKPPVSRDVVKVFLALEILQDILIIHDDIIDRSTLRRGKPSLHIVYGGKKPKSKKGTRDNTDHFGGSLALVGGDVLFSFINDAVLASHISPQKKLSILEAIDFTISQVAQGQVLDITNGYKSVKSVTEEDILSMHTLKTAEYSFCLPLKMGAILSGTNKKNEKNLIKVGTLLGQAFQIKDDIIGLYEEEEGKPIGQDLLEGKKTLLVRKAYENGSRKEKAYIDTVLTKAEPNTKDLFKMQRIVRATGSLEYSQKQISIRLVRSAKILDGMKLRAEGKNLLQELISYLFPDVL